jgi:hypothetical protein
MTLFKSVKNSVIAYLTESSVFSAAVSRGLVERHIAARQGMQARRRIKDIGHRF